MEQSKCWSYNYNYKKVELERQKVSLTQNIGFAEISNRLGMRDWTAASVEAAFGASEVVKYNTINSFGLIDYEDEIYGNRGIISDTKLRGVSGGNDKTQFYVGTSYRDKKKV